MSSPGLDLVFKIYLTEEWKVMVNSQTVKFDPGLRVATLVFPFRLVSSLYKGCPFAFIILRKQSQFVVSFNAFWRNNIGNTLHIQKLLTLFCSMFS